MDQSLHQEFLTRDDDLFSCYFAEDLLSLDNSIDDKKLECPPTSVPLFSQATKEDCGLILAAFPPSPPSSASSASSANSPPPECSGAVGNGAPSDMSKCFLVPNTSAPTSAVCGPCPFQKLPPCLDLVPSAHKSSSSDVITDGSVWKFVPFSVSNIKRESTSKGNKPSKSQTQSPPQIQYPIQVKTDASEVKPGVRKRPLLLPKIPSVDPNAKLLPIPTSNSTDGTENPPISDQPTSPAQKRAARLIKNRAAASESRKRKREQHQMLESRAEQLQVENDSLRARVSELKRENETLRKENGDLRSRLARYEHRIEDDMTVDLQAPTFSIADDPVSHTKAVGTVFMVFLFSFALMCFPGLLPFVPHTGGHIASKAYSENAPVSQSGTPLLEAPPTVLYLPASDTPSESGLAPVSHVPLPLVESAVSLPLDGRFMDFLGILSDDLSGRSRTQLNDLRALFGADLRQSVQRRKHEMERGIGKLLLKKDSESSPDDSQPRRFIHVPPNHVVEYSSDGAAAKIVPFVSVTLMPYRDPIEPATSSPGPKVSLITTLPMEKGGNTLEQNDNSGGFLQLDLAVFDAKLVKWSRTV